MRGVEGKIVRAALLAVAVIFGADAVATALQDDDRAPREFPPPPPPEPPRPQTGHVAYRLNLSHPGHVDRENLASLSMASMDAVHLALQDSGDDPFYLRVPKWGGAFVIDSAIRFVNHEYGHLSVFSKVGYRQAIFGDKDEINTTAPKASFGKMFLTGANPFNDSAVSVSAEDWDRIQREFEGDPARLTRFRIAIKAGGLNQEEVLLDRYADRLLAGELSYLDTLPFMISAAAVLRYPASVEMSDVGDYIDEVRSTGARTSVGRIHVLSGITLLSGSSLAAFRGMFLGLFTGRGGIVEPFRIASWSDGAVFLPEFDNYLSEYGPTLKASVPVLWHGVMIQPGFERLFVGGDSGVEPGLSVRAPIVSALAVRACAYRHSNDGSWLEGGIDVLPFPWMALSLGYAWAHGYSFHRDVYGANNDLLRPSERSLLLGLSVFHRF